MVVFSGDFIGNNVSLIIGGLINGVNFIGIFDEVVVYKVVLILV